MRKAAVESAVEAVLLGSRRRSIGVGAPLDTCRTSTIFGASIRCGLAGVYTGVDMYAVRWGVTLKTIVPLQCLIPN